MTGSLNVTRRSVLGGLASIVAPSGTIAITAHAGGLPTPEQRIEAAMAEIEAAMLELYPGWHVQMRNDVVRPSRYVKGGPDILLDPCRHAVVVYASRLSSNHEEVRWFVNDKSPLLADDVTGTTAFADWERSRS